MDPPTLPDFLVVSNGRIVPANPLDFIKDCLRLRRIYWTYHVNMRMAGRYITRDDILQAIDTYEVIESYPEDKYLPSYLLLGNHAGSVFHVPFALDVDGNNVRIVTAYNPDPTEWQTDLRTRRKTP